MARRCSSRLFGLILVACVFGYAILPASSYPAETDAVVIGANGKSEDTNTKIFTGNEQNDNILAAGVVGLGVGVGGVLLAQALLDKPNCRYKRFGDLFGGNKDCNRHQPNYPPRPRPPYHGGGGYREPNYDRPYRPPSSYKEPQRPYRPHQQPYRPPRPYKEPYRPHHEEPYYNRPPPSYHEPHRPSRPYKEPYRDTYRPQEPYREPYRPTSSPYKEPPRQHNTPYRNPKPNYATPAVYRPTPSSHHEPSNAYYPQRPVRGRALTGEDSKVNLGKDAEETSNVSNQESNSKNTGGLLSGHVRFGD